MSMRGHVESLTRETVRGWVFDPERPISTVRVSVFDGDSFVACIPANQFRQDLEAAGMGNGCHAFHFTFPPGIAGSAASTRVVTDSGVALAIPVVTEEEDRSEKRFAESSALRPGPSESSFLCASYQRDNYRRLEHLATLLHAAQISVANRSVLETGAGIGDHTSFFLDRGCSVFSIEPRQDNFQVFMERYAPHPKREHLRVEQLDVERLARLPTTGFDIVYSYGMLHHCAAPGRVLASVCEQCSGVLLLETHVASDDACDPYGLIQKDTTDVSGSFHGGGCLPTRAYILRKLRDHMPYAYISRTQPWHEEFPIAWTRPNTEAPASRAIMIGSRSQLDSNYLIEGIPSACTRF